MSCLHLDVGEAKSKKAKTEPWGPPTLRDEQLKKMPQKTSIGSR